MAGSAAAWMQGYGWFHNAAAAPLPACPSSCCPLPSRAVTPSKAYFADTAITDDLTTDLSRISGSRRDRPQHGPDLPRQGRGRRQIGHELSVRYIPEGSVRQMGDQVEVNAQLIDTEKQCATSGRTVSRPIDAILQRRRARSPAALLIRWTSN